MDTPKKKAYINLKINERLQEMMNELREQRGFSSDAEVVREALRIFYDTLTPRRPGRPVKPAEEPKKTPEEKCQELGGEVVEEKGIRYCKQKFGDSSQLTPLELL